MRIVLFIVFFALTSVAEARLGETAIQFADRYGSPKDSPLTKITDKSSPLLAGAIHHTYNYQGWKIRAAFLQLDGPCVRMDFQKLGGTGTSIVIQDYELQAIANANTSPGMSWKPMLYDNPDFPNKGWRRWPKASWVAQQGKRCGNERMERFSDREAISSCASNYRLRDNTKHSLRLPETNKLEPPSQTSNGG